MNVALSTSKYLLLLSNILILLSGMGMVATGVYTLSMGSNLVTFVSTGLPIGVLLLGILLVILALIGLYGTMMDLAWALQLVYFLAKFSTLDCFCW